jgi:hypothetical protein
MLRGRGKGGGGIKALSISLFSFFPFSLPNMINKIPVIIIPSSFYFYI